MNSYTILWTIYIEKKVIVSRIIFIKCYIMIIKNVTFVIS